VTTGSANPPYSIFSEKDQTNSNVTLQYQSITCMPAYRGVSFEVSPTSSQKAAVGREASDCVNLDVIAHACEDIASDLMPTATNRFPLTHTPSRLLLRNYICKIISKDGRLRLRHLVLVQLRLDRPLSLRAAVSLARIKLISPRLRHLAHLVLLLLTRRVDSVLLANPVTQRARRVLSEPLEVNNNNNSSSSSSSSNHKHQRLGAMHLVQRSSNSLSKVLVDYLAVRLQHSTSLLELSVC
jgi:hypothetical protein